MSSTTIDQRFKDGVRAAKAGDRETARAHFLNVIEQNERHELAWLWLSTTVSKEDEQILCLENVLTINPNNERAQRRLEKLRGVLTIIDDAPAPESEYRAESGYDDIWTQDVDLCPYCATVIEARDKTCLGCKRPLVAKSYRYAKTTSLVHMFWVVLLGLSNINLVQALFDFVYWRDIIGVLVNLAFVGIFFVLAIGAGFRRLWAWVWSQIVLGFVLLYGGFDFFFPLTVRSNALPEMNAVFERFIGGLGSGFDLFLFIFEMAGAFIGMILAVIFLAPDFEQVERRLVAKVGKTKPNAADYDYEAKRFARSEMWATAVLHWQRAAALAPAQLGFQERLADGYARLGFYTRSLDVLQSAHDAVYDANTKARLRRQIEKVKAIQEATPTQPEKNR